MKKTCKRSARKFLPASEFCPLISGLRAKPALERAAGTLAGICLAAALFVPDMASAKVYRLHGRTDAAAIAAGRAGGQTLFESAARMNGVPGTVRVMRYRLEFEDLRTTLRQAPPNDVNGAPMEWRVGERHALGISGSGNLLLMNMPETSGTLGFRFERKAPADGQRQRAPAAGLPAIPGAVSDWTLEIADTGMSLYSATTAETPQGVREAVDRILRRRGWRPALETPRSATPPRGLPVYLKGGDSISVQVTRSAMPGAPTRIVMARKSGGLH